MTRTHNTTLLQLQAKSLEDSRCFTAALDIYKKINALNPKNISILIEIGRLNILIGNYTEAEDVCRKSIELNPEHSMPHYLLGSNAQARKHPEEAITHFRNAIKFKPLCADAYNDLSVALYERGDLDDAASVCNIFLNQGEETLSIIYNLGLIRKDQLRTRESEVLFRKALEIAPNNADIHNSLGYALSKQLKLTDAENSYRNAIRLNPEFSEAYFHLGTVLYDQFRFCDAELAFRQACALQPNFSYAYRSLANVLLIQGNVISAEQNYRHALTIDPTNKSAHTNLLLTLHYRSTTNRDTVYGEHLKWCQQHAEHTQQLNHTNNREPNRKLRIGYISSDFRTHSVAYFLKPLFNNHDRTNVEIYGYSDVKQSDAFTHDFQQQCDHWLQIFKMTDNILATRIQRDQIDILVDLSGHTANNRLGVFAFKPTPIQITYLGYPDTTGLSTMDYRLTDRVSDPEGSEQWHSEKLLYLENGFLCYNPPPDAPTVSPAPVHENKHITFGSFNNIAKVSPETLETWIEILHRVPGSHLLLKSKAFFDVGMIERFRKQFHDKDIEPERIEVIGWSQHINEHLSLYSRVDIALDPFPYNGTTTTCEALWMGVPVVTMKGVRHCSRVGASLLESANLREMITQDQGTYISLATSMATDTGRLDKLRQKLRPTMTDSCLCNGHQFAQAIEHAYRNAWKKWCSESST